MIPETKNTRESTTTTTSSSSNVDKSIFTKYGEWIFRAILLIAIGLNLWLTQSFVTRGEFDRQSKENLAAHLIIQTSVNDIATTMKILAANVAKLDDHELRIRIVEMRQTDVLARLNIVEKQVDKENHK